MARCYRNAYGRTVCEDSAWNNWVRWVVLVVVVIGFLLLFVLCSCLTARRRRKAGRQPFYGTGWAARPGHYNNQNSQQPYYNPNHQPAPPYSAATDNHNGYYGGGANQGYYGQQSGVELQSPQPAYNGYAPPPGPPPAKV
ncbi:chitin synthesis regulation congo red resistance rcr protein [Stemphylium lycopersici]|uniref:Chitin synthesis regulation congo red resistance rcr protein n=1 Tax=Stemphylium lycopersici TaxID=183478 RepID=A0A364MZ54_STELY|nr:chitin synthesis regulation congo red resistance rcr protein [Stemphylium lycopersici]RAQ99615.1 chitin synthesis regulation congo red resistance rcr protein [Stemphylium lycopersici]RAR07574.1 chitin synthesis regulation congo red resistance rcr protein [Stemphylium lycopersici]